LASTDGSARRDQRPDTVGGLRKIGWLVDAKRIVSPNHDPRPDGTAIDLLVIHNISLPPGIYGGNSIVELFTNKLDREAHPYFATIAELRVSAHLLIRRGGEVIQFVAFHERAWHCGASQWKGREGCNDFSIGIELEGTDDEPFTMPQYAKLIGVTQLLQRAYPVTHATGHSDISPGRKTDPGPLFNWRLFRSATGLQ
jgi:N-acetyl-anhydromuramoyl-L-alanine amidase